jgi:hypothetical protein
LIISWHDVEIFPTAQIRIPDDNSGTFALRFDVPVQTTNVFKKNGNAKVQLQYCSKTVRLLQALAAATEAKDRQNVWLLQQKADDIAENHVHSERVLYVKFNTAVVFIINPILVYGAETWTMTKKDEQALLIFERKIFRRIYGPKYEDGKWKRRTNRELEEAK